MTAIHEQSPDIAMGVNDALETRSTEGEADTGAGDQGGKEFTDFVLQGGSASFRLVSMIISPHRGENPFLRVWEDKGYEGGRKTAG